MNRMKFVITKDLEQDPVIRLYRIPSETSEMGQGIISGNEQITPEGLCCGCVERRHFKTSGL
jgi:hypothetical protein